MNWLPGETEYSAPTGPIKTEDDPLDPTHPLPQSAAAAAERSRWPILKQSVSEFGGIDLRYGAVCGAANASGTAAVGRSIRFEGAQGT